MRLYEFWTLAEHRLEREALLIKIVDWAQKRKRRVESIVREDILEAIKCKF